MKLELFSLSLKPSCNVGTPPVFQAPNQSDLIVSSLCFDLLSLSSEVGMTVNRHSVIFFSQPEGTGERFNNLAIGGASQNAGNSNLFLLPISAKLEYVHIVRSE